FLFFFLSCILFLSVHGLSGNPTAKELQNQEWSTGPFESSNARGRYALVYSLLEDHSLHFSLNLAQFASPDLAYSNGHFVSLFAPGVSFITIPGYLIGKYFGNAQVGTFLIIGFFALCNFFLIKEIAMLLGANKSAAILGAFAFLCASPAFAYATTLFQHHISTFLMLLSAFLLIRFNGFISLFFIWFLVAVSVTVDYPNLFIMLPIVVAALSRVLMITHKGEKHYVTIS